MYYRLHFRRNKQKGSGKTNQIDEWSGPAMVNEAFLVSDEDGAYDKVTGDENHKKVEGDFQNTDNDLVLDESNYANTESKFARL